MRREACERALGEAPSVTETAKKRAPKAHHPTLRLRITSPLAP
jgi:hypothetical protein